MRQVCSPLRDAKADNQLRDAPSPELSRLLPLRLAPPFPPPWKFPEPFLSLPPPEYARSCSGHRSKAPQNPVWYRAEQPISLLGCARRLRRHAVVRQTKRGIRGLSPD